MICISEVVIAQILDWHLLVTMQHHVVMFMLIVITPLVFLIQVDLGDLE